MDLQAKLKACFLSIFPDLQLIISPGIVADKFGKVLVWYFPATLQPQRKVCYFFCDACMYFDLSPGISLWELQVFGEGVQDTKELVKLEDFPELFKTSIQHCLKPGVMNVAPAWFEQGHIVSSFILAASCVQGSNCEIGSGCQDDHCSWLTPGRQCCSRLVEARGMEKFD